MSVAFSPGHWHTVDGRLATREEIMMTLAGVENILIKLQYIDQVQREVELLNIVMDSAATRDQGLGSASLVEQCRCPIGYSGLSCEACAHGYTRQQTGAWLGRCVREEEPCKPGQYGDPKRGFPCKVCPCPLTTSGNNFARTCSLGPDGDVVCNCDRGYTGRRCEECERGFTGNPLISGGSCTPIPQGQCDRRGTQRIHSDGLCECKQQVTGVRCDQCTHSSFFLNADTPTGCTQCFCSGVSKTCTSSSWFRDTIHASFSPSRNEFRLVSDYEYLDEAQVGLDIDGNEVSFRGNSGDSNVYYWELPPLFAGNKVSSYGGSLNYTIRYVPTQGGFMSRNNAPDAVIKSSNGNNLLHYRRDEVTPSGSQSYQVPIADGHWQSAEGNVVSREDILTALADVSAVLVKATYTTTTEEAGLSQVSLDSASQQNRGSYLRAVEVEQCSCPAGHQGLSCEHCAPGYTRNGQTGGFCEQCECNNHSDECDPISGVCSVSLFYFNCLHLTNLIFSINTRTAATTQKVIIAKDARAVSVEMRLVDRRLIAPTTAAVMQALCAPIATSAVLYLVTTTNVNANRTLSDIVVTNAVMAPTIWPSNIQRVAANVSARALHECAPHQDCSVNKFQCLSSKINSF